MSKQQIILKIMDGVRRLGIRPSDILGKGTNVFRFPKQGEINPFDPNMLRAMKQFGEDSVQAAKDKLADGLRYLTTENEMNLTNYLNNLNDFLRMGKGQEPIKEGLAGTKTAEIFDIGKKKLLTGTEKETLEQTQGLPGNIDPDSPLGSIMNMGKRLRRFTDEAEGITPEARRKLDQEKINQIIQQVNEAGGSMDDVRNLLNNSFDLDITMQKDLPQYLTAKKLGAKTNSELALIKDAEETLDLYSDNTSKLNSHLEQFYTPRLIISRIDDAIADNLRQTGKFTEDEIENLTLYSRPDTKDPTEYIEGMKKILADVGYDLDTTVYKNYADEYTYGSEKLNQRIKGIKPKVDDEEPFADGGRVKFDQGGSPMGEGPLFTDQGPQEPSGLMKLVSDYYNYKKLLPMVDEETKKYFNNELEKGLEKEGIDKKSFMNFVKEQAPIYDPYYENKAQGGRVGFNLGGGVKGKAIQGILNLIRSKYGQEAMDTLENLYKSGKLKLNDIKKKFLEDREAIQGFEKREKENIGTLQEFYDDFIKAGGNPSATLEDLKQAYNVKKSYPFNTPYIDKTGKLIGGEATQKMYPESKKFYIEDADVLSQKITDIREGKLPRTAEGERTGIDVPPAPAGFKLSREKLLENYPEIDEDFADEIMDMDKDMQLRMIEMLKNRRLNPELYDELLEKYAGSDKFQGEFDKAIRKTKNAYGGLINEGVSTLFMEK